LSWNKGNSALNKGRFSFSIIFVYIKDKVHVIDVEKAVEFVVRCMNFDGGFGCTPGSESHSGQVTM